MKTLKRILALGLLCLMALSVPVLAAEEAAEAPTLPPRMIGVWELSQIPESWNPLAERDADQAAILSLTSEPLYRIADDGQILPVQAAALPEDVTAEFAGSYGIPDSAPRGYAFAIPLREGTFWDDGQALTADDWQYTVEMLLAQEKFPLEIANYRAYHRGDKGPASQIVSLEEAGFSSVAQAEEAGIRDFYVETNVFWGLETGWRRITDRTRLFDEAIPSGCEEMYVTPAYLYQKYLSSSGELSKFQREFVGVPAKDGEPMTSADVGLLVQEGWLVLILQERTTPGHLALVMSEYYPVRQGTNPETYGTEGNYTGCGKYRILSVTDDEITLEPNPYWTGETAELESLRCTKAS